MALFQYRAKDVSGQIVEGELEAKSLLEARDFLAQESLVLIDLQKKQAPLNLFKEDLDFVLKHVPRKEIVLFTRQLSLLVGAQVTLVQALEMLSAQVHNNALQEALQSIHSAVASGKPLSEGLQMYPRYFDPFYTNMVRSGERSGRIQEVLSYLAVQYEKDYELTRKVQGALMYPAVIIVTMGIALIVLIMFVIPKLVDVFDNIGAELPYVTQVLIMVSDFLRAYWYLGLGGFAIGLAVLRYVVSLPGGELAVSALKLRIPFIGKFFQYIYMLRFSQSMKTLLQGGIDVLSALHITEDVVTDAQYRRMIRKTSRAVEDGANMSTVFATYSIVPGIFSELLSVGERSGQLSEMFDHIAHFYDKEIDAITRNITALIEPLVMVLLGVVVTFLVASVFLPLYQLPSL